MPRKPNKQQTQSKIPAEQNTSLKQKIPKTPKIQKQIKNVVWKPEDRKKMLLYMVNLVIEDPEIFITANNWRPVNYFVNMAKHFGSKTAAQCKSYDQRLKNQCRIKYGDINLLQRTIIALKEEFTDCPIVKTKLLELKIIVEADDSEQQYKNEIKESMEVLKNIRKQMEDDPEQIFIKR